MRSIVESTEAYEHWLGDQIPLITEDLKVKHHKMAADSFQFLRATFYRWCELWPQICRHLADSITVLGVGDLHVQNFGTWRDAEGRLVWGVNDFDDASSCAIASDLIRTAVSAQLATRQVRLVQGRLILLSPREILESLWKGYERGVEIGGRPIILDRRHPWLLRLARSALKDPKEFWDTWLDAKTEPVESSDAVPKGAQEVLLANLPTSENVQFRWKKKEADPKGLGSLGRMRFFALIDWLGGPLAREAKAAALSSWLWAEGKTSGEIQILEAANRAVRSPDPYLRIQNSWLVRPVAADCGRIDLDALDQCGAERERHDDQLKLLRAMGFETANVHLGSASKEELTKALKTFTIDAFKKATQQMLQAVEEDYAVWRRHWQKNGRT